MSTIIMKVDLDCHRCYKKISKTICKLQERTDIQTVAFDETNNTVTISGPFDPQKLSKKLCCKAGNVIKDLQIKEKPKETKPAEPEKDKPKETKPAEPSDAKPTEPAEPKKDKPKDDKPAEPKDKPVETKDEPKKDKPKDPEPKKDKPDQPPPGPVMPELVPQPVWAGPVCVPQPVWAGPVCGCGCRSWYDGYYGDNRCCWCGRGYGFMPEVPPPTVVYGAPAYGGCKTSTFFCEEDPQSSCSIM